MTIGPVQFVAIGFDRIDRFRGEIINEIEAAESRGTVRILDFLFVMKEENGDLVALEFEDDDVDEDDDLGELVGALMGFEFEGDDFGSVSPEELGAHAGLSLQDIQDIGLDLEPGTAAAVLLVEHRWAKGFRDAVIDAGGRLLAEGFVSADGLMTLGTELAAVADAVDAIEEADAAEAEATLRELEALAVIDATDELKAAIAAQTVRTLVEAGFIEGSEAGAATEAVIDAKILQTVLEDGGVSA